MAHAYHGVTDAISALTLGAGGPRDAHVAALAPPTDPDVAAAAADVDRAVLSLTAKGFAPAAFYLDTALTSSGIFDAPPAWLAAVAERVRAAGGLVIADEVQYGLGRSGSHFWGFERRGLTPDIVTLGKPVGNGYPMGVVIASRDLIEAFQEEFGFFSTFGGSPVAAAAGRAVLAVLEREALLVNARDTGAYLRAQLAALAAQHACFGAVRGAGLLVGLQVDDPRRTKAIVNRLAAHSRILIGSEGPDGTVLKIRPPMPFGRAHVDRLVEALDAAAKREVSPRPGVPAPE
jgi:4-aminobutyrate aminotransferase-like enzyme